MCLGGAVIGGVALRKESVDRNSTYVTRLPRAQVALRKESVDRNAIRVTTIDGIIDVALRKESVDRNARLLALLWAVSGRSPQGERG